MRRALFSVALIFCYLAVAFAEVGEQSGSWTTEFRDSLGSGTGSLALEFGDSKTLKGTYKTDSGGEGAVVLRWDGSQYKFILTQTTTGCAGSFAGELSLVDGKMAGTYTGTDCKGWHDGGKIAMTRTMQVQSAGGPDARTFVNVHCGGGNFVASWRAPSSSELVERVGCDESVQVLGEDSGGWTHVRTMANNEGYIPTSSLTKSGSGTGSAANSPIKEVPADTVFRKPERIPTMASNGKRASPSDYPLSIRVLQTDQIPYSVQYGGGGVSTNCSINGSTYTTGFATSVGNSTFGNATSNTDLNMHCASQENPPLQWGHVLNTMLVVASNGNAYIIACDAAWRWSKCRGLITGDTFSAKINSKGLAVQYYVNGKPKEGTYSVLQGKVLSR
jgi:hypothetical protein